MRSDGELVRQSLQGNRHAYGELVLRYHKLVTSVAYRVCGDAALAEDVAQDAFLRAWDRLHTFRLDGNYRAWLCRIATNLSIDAVRRRKPTVGIDDVLLAARGDPPEATAIAHEQADVVRRAILDLPVTVRAALVLREYEGLSYAEIADVLDVPIGTVKSRLSDARRRLREMLAFYVEG